MSQTIDLLDRNDFIDRVNRIINQLSDNKKGSCFSIEGSWGIGKTFVLNGIREKLEAEKGKYFLFHYNCWQHDYYEEPAVAIISAMKASIKKDSEIVNEELEDTVKAGYKFIRDRFKEIAGIYLENKIGINLINWADEIEKIKGNEEECEQAFDKMFSFSQAIDQVREIMKKIAEKRTIVLIVDELDRCIPQYAIKVLERLHHLFYGLKNVVVIIAVDKEQLRHSVEEMFGMKEDPEKNAIDVEKYLKKFIDFSITLDYGKVNDRYQEQYPFYFDRFLIDADAEQMLKEFLPCLFTEIDIRRIEKMIEKANVIHSVICKDRVDISVLVFELLYEILRFFDVENMECVVFAGEKGYTDFDSIKEVRLELFKQLKIKSMSRFYNQFCDNPYGRVFWYCVNIFCSGSIWEEGNYDFPGFEEKYAKELETAQKYCEFRKTIN